MLHKSKPQPIKNAQSSSNQISLSSALFVKTAISKVIMLTIAWGIMAAFTVITSGCSQPSQKDIVRCIDNDTVSNKLITLQYERTTQTLIARSRGRVLFAKKFANPGVSVIKTRNELGQGYAVSLASPQSSAVITASLYPQCPFVVMQYQIINKGQKTAIINNATPISITWPGKKVLGAREYSQLRVLGCDGLTTPDKKRISYTFLAAASSVKRKGIVAGWLSSKRGSGIVLAQPDKKGLKITAKVEYGRLRLSPGQKEKGELFVIGYFDDALYGLEQYADAIAKVNHVHLNPITSGYCTWYSQPHGGAADEKSLTELSDFARKNLVPFGFKTVQIDDHWQGKPRPNPDWGPAADFTHADPHGPYPHGMKSIASKLKRNKQKAGIWLLPFAWDPHCPSLKNHNDWFVKKDDGSIYYVMWAGWCLDMTNPDAKAFLTKVISTITKKWGYKYLKLDGLWAGMAVKILYPQPTYRPDNIGDAVFYNPNKTNIEAYRDGLRVVRKAAGKDVFMLGCNIAQNMRTLAASFGLVDAMRIGSDITTKWGHIKTCATMGSRLYFLHSRVWYNDPDCLLVRKPLTLNQARAWGSWIGITGELNMVSEWLPSLPADRLDIIKRTMPNHGLCARPVDLFAHSLPQIWHLTNTLKNNTTHNANINTSSSTDNRFDIVAVFNWSPKPAKITVNLSRLSLPAKYAHGLWVGYEFWSRQPISPFTSKLTLHLPAMSCKVIALKPVLDRPQLVSTSRHVTQGIVDVQKEQWLPAAHTLTGISKVVAGDNYQLRIYTGRGNWQLTTARASYIDTTNTSNKTFVEIVPDDNLSDWAIVNIKPSASGEVKWALQFETK